MKTLPSLGSSVRVCLFGVLASITGAAYSGAQENGGGDASSRLPRARQASSAIVVPSPSSHSAPLGVLCVPTIRDNAGGCLEASSFAMLGMLYPLTSKFFVEEATGNIGMGTISPTASLHVEGDGGILATGSFGVGAIPIQGDGVRMMWYPAKAAFRVGRDEAASWDDANVGIHSFAAGRRTLASGDSSTVSGGRNNTASGIASTVSGGSNNTASGYAATVSGGYYNTASPYGTVSGGGRNSASYSAVVAGGYYNTASGLDSVVGGGLINQANGCGSTVSGGERNLASGNYSTVAGGFDNDASAFTSFVGGGFTNTASGDSSFVAGGECNVAAGDHSFAGGYGAKANHKGSFVWSAGQPVLRQSSADDQFSIFASGGVRIFSNTTANSGVLLAPGGGSWSSVSDRDAKENFEPVMAREVLEKVLAIPISTWNYKTQDDSIRHMGPMAQDFRAAFGLGLNDKTIDTIDPDGVALAAIQGLHAELKQLRSRQAVMEAQMAELVARLDRANRR